MTERPRQTWAETLAMAYLVVVPAAMAAALVRILEAAVYEATLDPDDEYDPDVVTVTRRTSGSVADRPWASPATD